MLDHDAADDPRACEFTHPCDHIEPDTIADETQAEREDRIARREYRQSAQVFAKSLAEFVAYVLNHRDSRLAAWILCYALELPPARGKTLETIGKLCGLKTRQAIDREVQKFCDATGFRVATPMRSQSASDQSRRSRIASILETQADQ